MTLHAMTIAVSGAIIGYAVCLMLAAMEIARLGELVRAMEREISRERVGR